ncbi:peptidylprolyl isomerase [Donghicola sp. C2-DW-16]|uniref:Parvulin-like PPIase n=1 Tax=Donghicola mangrovi TaxID=2729614 RepID=A0A850PZH5_9RHOB|nr:peptidylprolyl isomerase [Donghicola mangrovi]NVO22236.1 peptidylprolyl isomerase [Donghicola mangrovi]NVO26173.1 peptidylprolyl isomerase [Donghicola mangrovi]
MRSLKTLSAAVLMMGIGLSAVAQDAPSADTVVATVNGKEITLGHLLVARTALPQQYQQLPNDVLFNGLLDQVIQQQVLADSLETAPKRLAIAIENETRGLKAAEVIDGVATSAVDDAKLQAAYDARYANAEGETEYNANHILVETEEAAKAIVDEINGGADFETVAKEKSTGPSGPNGGALGWFSKGMMVPEFETAVMDMKAGDISAPVQTQFGWHVIKLNETREKAAPTLDEVREELTNEIQTAAIEEHIEALTDKADVDRKASEGIDPAVINQLDLLEQ